MNDSFNWVECFVNVYCFSLFPGHEVPPLDYEIQNKTLNYNMVSFSFKQSDTIYFQCGPGLKTHSIIFINLYKILHAKWKNCKCIVTKSIVWHLFMWYVLIFVCFVICSSYLTYDACIMYTVVPLRIIYSIPLKSFSQPMSIFLFLKLHDFCHINCYIVSIALNDLLQMVHTKIGSNKHA